MKLRGGVIENFKFWGIKADVVQSDKVRVPAFKGNRTFEFAKMVGEEEKKEEKKETEQFAEDKKEAVRNTKTADNNAVAETGKEPPVNQQKQAGGGTQ